MCLFESVRLKLRLIDSFFSTSSYFASPLSLSFSHLPSSVYRIVLHTKAFSQIKPANVISCITQLYFFIPPQWHFRFSFHYIKSWSNAELFSLTVEWTINLYTTDKPNLCLGRTSRDRIEAGGSKGLFSLHFQFRIVHILAMLNDKRYKFDRWNSICS